MSTDDQAAPAANRVTRTVRCELDCDLFNHINDIRTARGATWEQVILRGISDLEDEVPPYRDRYTGGDAPTAPSE